jgi:hypothetical protein
VAIRPEAQKGAAIVADDPYVVSSSYIAELGNWFIGWSKNWQDVNYYGLQMIVTPGSSPDGTAFKTVFLTDRVQKELLPSSDKARDAFYNTGTFLLTLSTTYDGTEDDATKDAESVRGFVTGLGKDYGSASVLLPPKYGVDPPSGGGPATAQPPTSGGTGGT